MPRKSPKLLMAAALSTLAFGGAFTATANADTATVGPWDLIESTAKTWGNYLTSDSAERFRWISDTAHSTRISVNSCYDYNSNVITDFPAHSTSYRSLGNWTDQCVALRGRSLYGNQNNLVGNFLF